MHKSYNVIISNSSLGCWGHSLREMSFALQQLNCVVHWSEHVSGARADQKSERSKNQVSGN